MRRALAALALAAAWTTAVHAQELRGTVTQADGRTPAPRVAVQAVNDSGTVGARALTDARGRYTLALPGAGRWTVRAVRIGYRPVSAAPRMVAAGESVEVRLALEEVRMTLAPVTIVGERVCADRGEETRAVLAAWSAARTALDAAESAAQAGALEAEWFTWRREWRGDSALVRDEQVEQLAAPTLRPFHSLAPESLATGGYRRTAGTNLAYVGPDARALLSESFFSTHCFRLRPGPRERPEWIGVEFEPARERTGVVDIRGTAWLDRERAQLVLIDYTYTNQGPRVQPLGGGGRIGVAVLDSGEVLVHRWEINLPGEGATIRDTAWRARSGGEVRSVRVNGRERYATGRTARRVRVVLGATQRALPGAFVMTDGLPPATALTDAAGEATLVGVDTGWTRLAITVPALRDITARVITRPVLVRADTATLVVAITDAQLVEASCPTGRDLAGLSTIIGRAAREDGTVIKREYLEYKWAPVPRGNAAAATSWITGSVRTNDRGRFVLCGVAPLPMIAFWRQSEAAAERPTWFMAGEQAPFHRVDLTLP